MTPEIIALLGALLTAAAGGGVVAGRRLSQSTTYAVDAPAGNSGNWQLPPSRTELDKVEAKADAAIASLAQHERDCVRAREKAAELAQDQAVATARLEAALTELLRRTEDLG